MTSRSARLFVCLGAIVAFGSMAHAQTDGGPLQLTIACEDASEFLFRVTVENVGASPTAAIVGSILGNDRTYVPGPLTFTVSRPGVADSTIDYPVVNHVGGRLDQWLIQLPAGASYSMVVPVPAGFRSIPMRFRDLLSMPAGVHVQLKTQEHHISSLDLQGQRFIRVWVGTLTSPRIRFPESCRR